MTSYIDGSVIYGNNAVAAAQLRTFQGGKLATSPGIVNPTLGITNRTYLPLSGDMCSATNATSPTGYCFKAGDHRTSENLNLVSIQTTFNREHNRIATQLAALNPTWSDETLYQTARKIVIAFLQHITYNEWLPTSKI